MEETRSRSALPPIEIMLAVLYIFGRLILFLCLIPKDIYGAGDLPGYFEWAGLNGWPFFSFWVEYPPVFPLIVKSFYLLSGAQVFLFDFLIVMLISICGGLSIYVFAKIARRLFDENEAARRIVIYFAILAPLPYTWWYFDLFPLLLVLLGLAFLLMEQEVWAGTWAGLGIITKWFPVFLLPAVWRFRPPKKAAIITGISLGITAAIIGLLLLVSPSMSSASFFSQPSRTSWETVWAIIDGNYTTGAFVPLDERTNPAAANFPRGNPARISSRITFIFFAGLGIWLFFRVKNYGPSSLIAFVGITWVVFLLWSPGWSPQWILYLIPLILLTLQQDKAIFWTFLLVLVAVLEWPTFFTHNLWWGLWIVAPARTILFIFLLIFWYRIVKTPAASESIVTS